MRTAIAIILVLLACGQATRAETRDDIVDPLMHAFGLEKLDEIEAIRFTYNLKDPNRREARSWLWHPQTNRVLLRSTLDPNDQPIAYDRDDVDDRSPERVQQVDAQFARDTIWLMFPRYLATHDKLTVKATGYRLAPLARTIARQVLVQSPNSKPGEFAYVYIDDNDRIIEWDWYDVATGQSTLRCIWARDERVGPLVLTTDFRNNEADLRVWFTGLAVRRIGSGDWIDSVKIDHRCRTCP